MKTEKNFFKPPFLYSLNQEMSEYLLSAGCSHPERQVYKLVVE